MTTEHIGLLQSQPGLTGKTQFVSGVKKDLFLDALVEF